METRIRLLLLSCLIVACSGCALMPWHHRAPAQDRGRSEQQRLGTADRQQPRSAPDRRGRAQVQRRTVTVPKIGPSNVELGAYYGELSIQDFGAQPVAGLRADYHITEDFFFEATMAAPRAARPASRF